MAISPARRAAFDVLLRIERDRAFSSILLPEAEAGLSAPDKALTHEITLGALRRQLYLDHVIGERSRARSLDVEVRIALRLGIYQLLFLDRVPDHAAINDSVELVKRAKKGSAKGLVNAILRRITREGPGAVPADESIRTSHPVWLLDRWAGIWGREAAVAIAEANNREPAAAMRAVTATGKELLERSGSLRSSNVPGCYLSERISPEMRSASEQGNIYFQDEGSQMVGWAAAQTTPGKFLDVCASPGGKATQIANALPDARIVAGDVTASRVALLAEITRRFAPGRVDIIRYDGELPLPLADGHFDTVLVDAPCSGTGTIGHNPEIRYHLRPEDLPVFSRRQSVILENASNAVRPGGHLIYSTCSLEPEENEAVIDAFLMRNRDWTLERPHVPERFITKEGYARTFPHCDGMDGFFISVLRKA